VMRVTSVMLVVFCVDYIGQTAWYIYKKFQEKRWIKTCLGT